MVVGTQSPAGESAYKSGAFGLGLALAVILGAHAFERFGGYPPCELCLQQRWAYYVGIPALFLSLVLYTMGRGKAAGLLFFLVSLAFFANACLGVYHAGIEWKFWPGPTTCSAGVPPLGSGIGGVLGDLEKRSVKCDEASWRMLGLSFAGWNVVLSMLVFTAAIQAAFAAVRRGS